MSIKLPSYFRITSDSVFKFVFKRKQYAKHLIEKILGQTIRSIKSVEAEKVVNDDDIGAKGVRFDIYVEDEEGSRYDVEMQSVQTEQELLALRARYYASMMDVDATNKGDNYRDMKKTVVIFLCNFAIFDGKLRQYNFIRCARQNKDLELKDNTEIIFLSSKGAKSDIIDEDVASFLDYMNGKTKTDNLFVKSIDKEVKAVNKDPVIRRNIMKWEMKLREEREYAASKALKEKNEFIIITSLKEKLPLTLIAKLAETTVSKVKEVAKKHNLENLIVNNQQQGAYRLLVCMIDRTIKEIVFLTAS